MEWKPYQKPVIDDPSFFVRHEAAVALGVIGSEQSRKTLERALNDESEEVRESAMIAIANLDYIAHVKRNNKFTSLTGGIIMITDSNSTKIRLSVFHRDI